jgi:hypothetical protein
LPAINTVNLGVEFVEHHIDGHDPPPRSLGPKQKYRPTWRQAWFRPKLHIGSNPVGHCRFGQGA